MFEFEEIGSVRNHADTDTLQLLALFKDSISEIQLIQKEDSSKYFSPDYSHYFIVHTPLDIEYPEHGLEWTRRYSGRVGVSIVELMRDGSDNIYVKGLMARNGAKVYAVLPFTHIDSVALKGVSFPESRPLAARDRVWPAMLAEIQGTRILDVGCGFGRLTLDVAKRNQNSKVFGIDLLDSQIEQARMNARVLDISNVEFKTASAYALPFPDGAFETVFSFFMLHHLDEIPRGLAEIQRVLEDEGRFMAVEPTGHHHGPNYSRDEWKGIFAKAGFVAEVEEQEGALIIRARKSDESERERG